MGMGLYPTSDTNMAADYIHNDDLSLTCHSRSMNYSISSLYYSNTRSYIALYSSDHPV